MARPLRIEFAGALYHVTARGNAREDIYQSLRLTFMTYCKAIDLSDGLPPVLPIVIYNGDARWNHSPEVFDLIQPHPAVLTEFQPKLKFWLLDEGRFSAEYLEGRQRVMAAIFRMEHAHDTEEGNHGVRPYI